MHFDWQPKDGLRKLIRFGVIAALTEMQGNKTHSARLLGISLRNIRLMLHEFDLNEFKGHPAVTGEERKRRHICHCGTE